MPHGHWLCEQGPLQSLVGPGHAGDSGEGTARRTQLPSWLCPNKDFLVPSSFSFHSPGQISKLSKCLTASRAAMWDLHTRVAGLCVRVFTSLLMSSDASAGRASSLSRAGEEHPIPSAATAPAPPRINFERLCKLK